MLLFLILFLMTQFWLESFLEGVPIVGEFRSDQLMISLIEAIGLF